MGGLGGGGDIGLSIILLEHLGLWNRLKAFVSFYRCSSQNAPGKPVVGALREVRQGETVNKRRFFEDKLWIVGWEDPVYVLCTKDPLEKIIEGLEWVVETLKPDCMLHTDIGGDGLLLGCESELGSFKTDTLARAALAHVSLERSIKSYIAVGALGGEGGGRTLRISEIMASLQLLYESGAVESVVLPKVEDVVKAELLLKDADSGMLPLYIKSVRRGSGRVRIDRAYLRGWVEIKPWYRYVIILDTVKHCMLSPLCSEVRRKGNHVLKKWIPPKPPGKYTRYVKLYTGRNPIRLFIQLAEKYADKRICG
jgi:hypothetical protein